MSKQQNGTLILYESFYEQFQLLSEAERGRLITAIFEYAFEGKEPRGLSPLLQMAFCPIRYAVDRDREHYRERCEKNAENGRLGGRPRKNSVSAETERFSEQTEKPYNKNNNKNKNNSNNNFNNKNGATSRGFSPESEDKAYDLEDFQRLAVEHAARSLGGL